MSRVPRQTWLLLDPKREFGLDSRLGHGVYPSVAFIQTGSPAFYSLLTVEQQNAILAMEQQEH